MPYFNRGAGLRLHFQLDGPAGAPVLVLSNSLGTDLHMWDPQMSALAQDYRVLRYDTRGHGKSSVLPGQYTVAQLGSDVIALLDSLDIRKAHFCGLSMGGMTGLWLGANHPARLRSLALCNTAAKIGTADSWNERIATVRREGMHAVVAAVLERWFTPGFREREPATVAWVAAMLESTPPEGYAANCAAVRDMDQRDQLSRIAARTLVIVGAHDTSTPPQDGRAVASAIPGSRLVELDAAHLSNIERGAEFTAALTAFLSEGS
jgi:3-oxoadipate enol-lactonase